MKHSKIQSKSALSRHSLAVWVKQDFMFKSEEELNCMFPVISPLEVDKWVVSEKLKYFHPKNKKAEK